MNALVFVPMTWDTYFQDPVGPVGRTATAPIKKWCSENDIEASFVGISTSDKGPWHPWPRQDSPKSVWQINDEKQRMFFTLKWAS